MTDNDKIFFEKFEHFKINFDKSINLIENKIAEKLSNQSNLDKFNQDLYEIRNYVNDTEKSLEELKSILKWNRDW